MKGLYWQASIRLSSKAGMLSAPLLKLETEERSQALARSLQGRIQQPQQGLQKRSKGAESLIERSPELQEC